MGQNHSKNSEKKPYNYFPMIIASQSQSIHLLNEAESIDGYRSKIFHNPIEKKARQNHNYYPMSDKNYDIDKSQLWCNNFIEKMAKSDAFSWIISYFTKNNIYIYIVILQYSADGGMPHTRPLRGKRGLICIPGGLDSLINRDTTILHELIHVIQRFRPDFWENIYKTYWNMILYTGTIPVKYNPYIRINPDTLRDKKIQHFLYKKKWIPLTVFQDISSPDIRKTKLYYFNIQSGTVWNTLPDELKSDALFSDLNIQSAALEHPNELSAYLFSDPQKFSNFLEANSIVQHEQ